MHAGYFFYIPISGNTQNMDGISLKTSISKQEAMIYGIGKTSIVILKFFRNGF
jgi:hypothetical protein